jgi:hypothetical protein
MSSPAYTKWLTPNDSFMDSFCEFINLSREFIDLSREFIDLSREFKDDSREFVTSLVSLGTWRE